MKKTPVLMAALVGLGLARTASAAVLYSNGPVDGTNDGVNIGLNFTVSDSFTLSSTSNVTDIDFASWDYPGEVPASVGWSITSAINGGTVFASGTGAISSTFLFTNSTPRGPYNIYSNDFTANATGLSAGHYYLNLSHALPNTGAFFFWDVNSGPSTAYQTNGVGSLPSETFTINGVSTGRSSVPEPSGSAALAIGLLSIGFLIYRRRRAAE
jgi:hypothetical protein